MPYRRSPGLAGGAGSSSPGSDSGGINVKSAPYSATGDGVTNDRTAILAAFTAATADGLTVYFPGGDYLISSGITVPAGVKVAGDPGARIFGTVAGNLVTVNDGVVLDGLTIENLQAESVDVSVAANSTIVRLYRLNLLGTAIGVLMGGAGCSNVKIVDCRFDVARYGFLSDGGTGTGAWDLRDVTIENCWFNVWADAIEFNHPTSAAAVAGGFTIVDNTITVPDRLVNAPSAGFGIGLANVRDCLVANNRLENIRNQGIHIEDDCANIVVIGNTVKNVDGTLDSLPPTQNVGISVAKSTNITVTGNHVETCRGAGFEMIYNGSNINDHITITENSVTDCELGFSMFGGPGGGHIICHGNRAWGNSSHGAEVGGQTAVQVTNNLFIENGGWGIYRPNSDGSTFLFNFRDNFLYGNTLGDISGSAISSGATTNLHDRSTYITGTTAGDGYDLPVAFRLGAYARGRVRLMMQNSSGHRKDIVQDVLWDGTTFRTATVRSAAHGTADAQCRSMVDGAMVLEIYTGTSKTYRVSARFDGLIIETNQAYSGTVMATALTGTAVATDTPQFTSVEVGHATDTTLSRSAAGVLAVEGVVIPTVSSTSTLTNKTLTSPAITTPTGIVKGDVGLGNVDNTADTAKPVSTATQTALDGKQNIDADLTAVAGLSPSDDDFLQRKAGAWANRTVAQAKTDLGLTGTNSGDQTSIVGITGNKAQFDTAVTDGNILYVGDVVGVTDGDKGDVTVSASGATWTVDNDAITLAKLQDIATARVLGRVTASTGDPEELTAAQARTLLNVADGAVAPPYHLRTGRWYPGASGGGSTSGYTTTNERIEVSALYVPNACTFDRIMCRIDIAGLASCVVRLGIWSSSANGDPATLVLDAGTVAGDSNGNKIITISQAVAAGLYWLSATVQGATSSPPQMYGLTGMSPYVGRTDSGDANITGNTGYSMGTASGALPGTPPSALAHVNKVPTVMVRIA